MILEYIHTRRRTVRTNIVIDDALMAEALEVLGHKSKRETVEDALRLLVRVRGQTALRAFRGKLHWEGNLESMRRD